MKRWRLSADAVDSAILNLIETRLSAPERLEGLVGKGADATRTSCAHGALLDIVRARSLRNVDERLRLWAYAILRVDIARDAMTMALCARSLVPDALQDAVSERIELRSEAKFDRRRQGMRVILGGVEQDPAPDDVALRLLARAQRWRDRWFSGDHCSLDEIAAADGVDGSDASKQLKLAFLAPDIVAAMLAGRADLPAERLRRLPHLPASWDEQRRLLLGE